MAEVLAELHTLQRERDALLNSTSWLRLVKQVACLLAFYPPEKTAEKG
jgi:hypothetical protein